MLSHKDFELATELVDKIINNVEDSKIEDEIISNISDKTDDLLRRNYLRHLNALFLNVILNRVNELGKPAEEKAFKARKIIYNMLKEQQVA